MHTSSADRTCPACATPVEPNPIGRPRTFCSPVCRSEFAALRRELPQLEAELVEADAKADSGFWPGERFWTAECHRLKLALQQVRVRLGDDHPEREKP